ncbi:hypothetical protein Pan216_17840 [Planctomycetes bacterium Pan216]|uniref:Uncharacterized protein n=1 Tax=Kolteria novifilia TaxID=2527975 RepID=A0A518B1S6_9BACT|nr:hypothetical protein Pan216_17840 [Planctomycetes bacterium Pan216]
MALGRKDIVIVVAMTSAIGCTLPQQPPPEVASLPRSVLADQASQDTSEMKAESTPAKGLRARLHAKDQTPADSPTDSVRKASHTESNGPRLPESVILPEAQSATPPQATANQQPLSSVLNPNNEPATTSSRPRWDEPSRTTMVSKPKDSATSPRSELPARIARVLAQLDPKEVDDFNAQVRGMRSPDEIAQIVDVWETQIAFAKTRPDPPANLPSKARSASALDPKSDPARQEEGSWPRRLPEESFASEGDDVLRRRLSPHREPHHSAPATSEGLRADDDLMTASRSIVSPERTMRRDDATAPMEDPRSRRLVYDRREVQRESRTSTSPVDGGSLETELRSIAHRMEETEAVGQTDVIRQQVYQRLLHIMAGESDQAFQPVRGGDSVDRNFWQSLLWAMVQYFNDDDYPQDHQRAAEVLRTLREALTTLELRADLEVTPPVFCKQVVNYGNYVEFDTQTFRSAQEIVIYWEVANFGSMESREGYRTHLEASLEIFDESGKSRHRSHHPFSPDVCRNRRRDYFQVILFRLPKELSAGDYTLRITVTDQTTRKVAENQRRFSIK